MKPAPLLYLILGIWLGGSVILGSVVAYNFSGVEDLFERNPRLQERAGFAIDDVDAKKTSLLWVHSSELNRVFFEVWNRVQLVIGGLAVVVALWAGVRRLPLVLLIAATALVAVIHSGLEPQMVDLGRQLDFVPRDPPPSMLADFQRYHGVYFLAESIRFGLVLVAALLLITGTIRSERA